MKDYITSNDFVKIRKTKKEYPTVIAFSSVNTPKGKFKPYRIVAESKVNIIFVNDNGNNWYQNGIVGISDNSKTAAEILIQIGRDIGNGRVITFGTSMGAFGAILFSILGKADGCLSFGPEVIMNEKGTRNERQLQKLTNIYYPDLRTIVNDSNIPIIVYASENDEVDLMSAYRLLDFNNVVVKTLKGIEHPSVQVFDLDGSIGEIIDDFSINGIYPTSHKRIGYILETNKEIIPQMFEAFLIKSYQRDFSLWLNYLEKINYKNEMHATLRYRIADAKYRTSNLNGCIDDLNKAIQTDKFQFEAYAKLGAILRRKGDFENALLHLNKSVEINPYNAFAFHTLGQTYKDLKVYRKAEDNFRHAISLNYGNINFKKSLAELLNEMSDKFKLEAENLISNTQ